MPVDLDTFLVTLYTRIDDLYQREIAPHKPVRRGRQPAMSDSEILTVVISAQWLGHSEQQCLRYAHTHWASYFPRLLTQSAFNRRARDLAGVLVHLIPLLADQLQVELSRYQVLDGFPVPLARRCRGLRHRLFADEAGLGKGGSDRGWYYGCRLLVAVSEAGVITGFVLGSASTEERWLSEALLCWRTDRWGEPWTPADLPPSHRRGGGYVGPTGPIWPRDGVGAHAGVPYLADRGLAGRVWGEHWHRDYQAPVITARLYNRDSDQLPLHEQRSRRQVVETVGDHLTTVFHLPYPRARTRWGLLTRVAAKLAAFNLGVWLNRLFGRADFAFATLFPG